MLSEKGRNILQRTIEAAIGVIVCVLFVWNPSSGRGFVVYFFLLAAAIAWGVLTKR
jgi:hypothetical protein